MNTQDFIEMEEKYGAHNYHPLDVVIEKAEGVWVYDVDGKRYLDCLSAYSAVNQGHVHPEILKALLDQAKNVTLTSRAFRNNQLPLLYKELSEMTGYEMSLPMNSGAEAVETAVKLARKWAYQVKKVPRHQAEIIVAGNNFHGRTVTIVSFSTEPSYRDDFGPFTPGFVVVEYGNADELEKAITPNTAAVMLEPIQGDREEAPRRQLERRPAAAGRRGAERGGAATSAPDTLAVDVSRLVTDPWRLHLGTGHSDLDDLIDPAPDGGLL